MWIQIIHKMMCTLADYEPKMLNSHEDVSRQSYAKLISLSESTNEWHYRYSSKPSNDICVTTEILAKCHIIRFIGHHLDLMVSTYLIGKADLIVTYMIFYQRCVYASVHVVQFVVLMLLF